MSNDLEYYRKLPYEREWTMREEADAKYFVVRLKDLPSVAGDGMTRDEAVEDLRMAFDEFVGAWLDSGQPVPEPERGFTLPETETRAPAKQWSTSESQMTSPDEPTPSWSDAAVIYENVLVDDTAQEPRLTSVASGV